MFKFLLIILLSLVVSCKSPKEESISNIIEENIKMKNFGGAVLLVQKQKKIIYLKAFGVADKGVKMTTEHIFDLASLTKVYGTTMGIMLLLDSKKIKLDDPVSSYLEEFNTDDKKEITIRNLLNHSSGLQEWKPLYYHAKNKIEAINFIANLPLKYPVGIKRKYSDLGFMVLGALIEKVSGKKLSKFLKSFYIKAGVKSNFVPVINKTIVATSLGNIFEKKMIKDKKFGYRCTENFDDFKGWRTNRLVGEVNDGNSHYVFKGISGHAGLFSTAKDINKLANILIEGGMGLIRPETIDKFTNTNIFSNGLGWAKSSDILKFNNSSNAYGHYGFTGTTSIIFPETKSALHLLTNRQFYGIKEKGYFDVRSLTTKLINYFELK